MNFIISSPTFDGITPPKYYWNFGHIFSQRLIELQIDSVHIAIAFAAELYAICVLIQLKSPFAR